jgi:hypothetical protein
MARHHPGDLFAALDAKRIGPHLFLFKLFLA